LRVTIAWYPPDTTTVWHDILLPVLTCVRE
jgi:hypothetical protein